jgi:hypothetical protein
MIQVRDNGPGEGFSVIDGMHRCTVLQQLFIEKWLNINYEQVTIPAQDKHKLP